jgi:hypothetical protein
MPKAPDFFKQTEKVSDAFHDLVIGIFERAGNKRGVRTWQKLKREARADLKRSMKAEAKRK